ncbi:MAG: M23 family metallopeptidase, partial [Saprospiraceae bacterium]
EVIAEDNFSRDFQQKRGQLPWPVESGFIARGYGVQKHPTLKNIEITNNGVDIRTEESAIVYAVFAGRVAGVQFIPGHDYTIIIQHGTYYTVYANLSETSINKDDQVRMRQPIGRVSNNAITGTTELHFELWFQKERLNPAQWIRK